MDLTYDIFRRLPDGGSIWIEAVHNLDHARCRLADLTKKQPGDYIVYDLFHQRIVAEDPSRAWRDG